MVETLRSRLQALQPLNERHRLTPFEPLVTAALLEFHRHACELVLEVGLGGRLDATTAHPCRPVVAVASIGMDHCEHLGHSPPPSQPKSGSDPAPGDRIAEPKP